MDEGKNVVSIAPSKTLNSGSTAELEIARCSNDLKPASDKQLAAALTGLVAVYGRPENWDFAMRLYAGALADLPYDVLVNAVKEHIKTSKWFPKPSEIREFASNSMYYLKANLADAERDYGGRHKQPWW